MKYRAAIAFAMLCVLSTVSIAQTAAASVAGDWLAVLSVQGMKLRLALRVSRTADGALTAKLDSIDQGARDLTIDEIVHDGTTLRFSARGLGLTYTGTVDRDGNVITGAVQLGGATHPLTFERTAAIPVLKRPQDPVRPYAYAEHDVRYTNHTDQAQLAGTLTVPAGPGRHAAVVLITGSGAQDRNETIAGHRPFLVLADYLTRNGIAVLRADDRGVGKSSAASRTDTSLTYAGDVMAAVSFLKQRSDIDVGRIGLIGHSEGGIIAAMTAARSADVAFIVMLAGMGQTGEDVILTQTRVSQQKYGATPELIAATAATLRDVFRVLRTEQDGAAAVNRMRAVLDARAAAMPEQSRKDFDRVRNTLLAQLPMYTTAWFRFFLDYDPAADLRNVRVPLLAITGALDVQAPARENLQRIQSGAAAGGNRNVTVHELPGLNHLLQTAKTGLPDEYGATEETIAPAALELIAGWIRTIATGGR